MELNVGPMSMEKVVGLQLLAHLRRGRIFEAIWFAIRTVRDFIVRPAMEALGVRRYGFHRVQERFVGKKFMIVQRIYWPNQKATLLLAHEQFGFVFVVADRFLTASAPIGGWVKGLSLFGFLTFVAEPLFP